MSDLIERRLAIDTIEHYLKHPPKNHSELFVQGMDDAYYRTLSILRTLPSAHPSHQWIPCSKALPNDGQRVLITQGGDYYYIAKFERGISLEERALMKEGKLEDPEYIGWNASEGYFDFKRSESHRSCDEGGNNNVPYCWRCDHGTWNGQDAKAWMELPEEYREEDYIEDMRGEEDE